LYYIIAFCETERRTIKLYTFRPTKRNWSRKFAF